MTRTNASATIEELILLLPNAFFTERVRCLHNARPDLLDQGVDGVAIGTVAAIPFPHLTGRPPMALFRKRPETASSMGSTRGSWYPDPLGRFDLRIMVTKGMSAEWGDHVRLGREEFRDPLPPAFNQLVDGDLDMMRFQAQRQLNTGTPPTAPRSSSKAERYYNDKVTALLEMVAPRTGPARRGELDGMMAQAMTISGDDYLEQLGANAAYRSVFNAFAPTASPPLQIAWFWDIDDYFQIPPFHDDLIFRGGQLALENMGVAERSFVGRRPQ